MENWPLYEEILSDWQMLRGGTDHFFRVENDALLGHQGAIRFSLQSDWLSFCNTRGMSAKGGNARSNSHLWASASTPLEPCSLVRENKLYFPVFPAGK